MADDLFNILASSARIKKKPKANHKKRSLNEEGNSNASFAIERLLSSTGDKNNAQLHTEEIAAFRRRMRIRVADPHHCPDPICTFREIKLEKHKSDKLFAAVKSVVLNNIEQGQWKEPTAIQMQAIPALLAGHDVMAAAPTGSGKSGAFIIPSIFLSKCGSNQVEKGKGGGIRALLLAPSRELAAQLHREVSRLGSSMPGKLRTALLSKSNYGSFVAGKLGGEVNGLDILVSTPLRLCEALQAENSKVDLSEVRIVTLDEADRLLDATDGITKQNNNDGNDTNSGSKESGSAHVRSFVEQIDTILGACGDTAIRAMFSATMGGKIRNLAESVLRNPVDVAVNSHGGAVGANSDIDQSLVFVGREDGKLLEIRKLIVKGMKPPILIFLQSQERAQALYKELRYEKINVDVIHAGKSQHARDLAVQNFRKGDTWVLICTDLVARGVDFKAVNLVINYDLPTSGVTYVHRVGRTGRAGRKGKSITFFTEDDFDNLRSIANVLKISGCEVADWMLHLKKQDQKSKRKVVPKKRRRIDAS